MRSRTRRWRSHCSSRPHRGGLGPFQRGPGSAPADAAAGHSVGELATGVIAGVLTADDAIRLVAVRGRAMAAAAATERSGMTAVLGGDQEALLAAIARHRLTPATSTGPAQIVAAGRWRSWRPSRPIADRGAARPLQVAGTFHPRHMAPAVAALRDAAADVTVTDPAATLLSDADGAAVTTGKEWLERIVAQIAAPVRWDLCMQTMADLGVTALIELPPAGTLTGLARRALPGVAQLAIGCGSGSPRPRGKVSASPSPLPTGTATCGIAADHGTGVGPLRSPPTAPTRPR